MINVKYRVTRVFMQGYCAQNSVLYVRRNKCCAQNKCLYANSVIREMNVASYKIK